MWLLCGEINVSITSPHIYARKHLLIKNQSVSLQEMPLSLLEKIPVLLIRQ